IRRSAPAEVHAVAYQPGIGGHPMTKSQHGSALAPPHRTTHRRSHRGNHRTTHRTLVVGLTALALGVVPWAATATTAAVPGPPGATLDNDWDETAGATVHDWNATAVAPGNGDAKRPGAEQSLWYGIVSAAVYNAVVGIEGHYAEYKWHAGGPRSPPPQAAAATAAHRVLLTYFPASKDRLDAALTAS